PFPSQFSFNSPLGACESCRGFGRTIGIDYGLVIPDDTRSLRGGAVKPWQTKSYEECQQDLERFAKLRGVPLDTPWRELPAEARRWVIEGEGPWTKKVWYGVQRVIGVMKRLRDAGNSLVVVEHDPQIMLEADRILDLGPGAGERGGEIVFFGTPAEIRASSGSLTGQYLAGRRMVAPRTGPALDRARTAGAP